jgi:hypothetical protein
MNFLMMAYYAVVFYVLIPGVLFTFPTGVSRNTVYLTHAVVFALIIGLTQDYVVNLLKHY